MKRLRVESSAVLSVGYDAKRKVLEVEFASGGIYQYFDVPASVYQALLKAESIGAFVNQKVKDIYACREL